MSPQHLLHFLRAYFSTAYVETGILFDVFAIGALFAVFLVGRRYSAKESALTGMLLSSGALWIFAFSSFAFCYALQSQYYYHTDSYVISLVAKLALGTCLAAIPLAFVLLRNRYVRRIFPSFSNVELESPSDRLVSIFSSLTRRSSIPNTLLIENSLSDSFPVSAALDWRGRKSISISKDAAEILDDDELESVLAHEIGHLRHRDSLRRTIATIYKVSFPFDPLSRFIEAAIYRQGEYNADEYSAELTGKPASLASALLKLYEFSRKNEPFVETQIAITPLFAKIDSGLLSKQPKLQARIERLLKLETRLTSQ